MRPIELLLDSCRRIQPLLEHPVLAERWSEPSVLDRWSHAGLAGHLARSAFNLERAVDQRRDRHSDLDVVGYYMPSAIKPRDPAIDRRIRELGDAEAAAGPDALAARFAETVAALRDRALPLEAATTVEMFGRALPIDECATACLLELVVHADDLTASLGLPLPEFSEPAVDLVVLSLTRIARARHGTPAVLRALARTERAPFGGISAF